MKGMKKMTANDRMQAVELLGVGLTVQEVSAILSRTEEEIAALKKKEEQGHGKDRT